MNALEEPIRAICAEYLDAQVGNAGFDYLGDFGTHLPSRVISQLLGVPRDEREHVLDLINTMFTIDAENGMNNPTSMAAMGGLYQWISAAVAERRGRDGDDLLSVIANVDRADDGTERKLTDQEAAAFGILLVSAGTETVARLLGWTALVLAAHPDQRAELAADPALIPNAVEELLRYEAPSPVQGRFLLRAVELHGQVVPEGSKVLLLTGSAGRDEREYPDADRFDIHRRFEQHVTFGVGPHYCLGAALARMEGRIAIEETLSRFPAWEVDHDKVERLHTSTVRGHKHVPIRVG
jgi:cytochrome P450